ncbi:universal stress protein [Haematospirillum jordaniae]|uniref:UspA domain-containing protein n=1 Tax=Haematospirillum jordaniae TaxID=1549855 RepID=A0A143DEQ8_9PROT|nr:universal stress protein [Haematospirillum jordaniae]AMW34763.1 hypothetical protein AY555_05740 [Haematospirillum jordaniae]NKD45492.1 universal stress protein [Haematospirillum jordaniae]NKD56877.1 universal stress protein [Haematospirillum jordaniae]NKD58967.1 universal stress protein [Haematospirillum jordaniae]NKD66802.1 universal stress protein [Haematospirillum jordaniae]
MSSLRILQAVVPDTEGGISTLETALLVARDFAAHIQVLHVRPDPAQAVPLVGEAMSGAMVDEMIRLCETRGREQSNRVHALFDSLVTRYSLPVVEEPPGPASVSISFREETGSEDSIATRLGRLCDLVIAGRPTGEEDPWLEATLNAVLMDSVRPLLVAPRTPVRQLGKSVAIAWNNSPEAVRAIHASLPFLLKAEAITVLVADEGHADAATRDLEHWLSWHGLAIKTRQIKPTGLTGNAVGGALLEAASQEQADLLVMGAFTHSRLRQLILGGVTRHVLDHATIPLLLCH